MAENLELINGGINNVLNMKEQITKPPAIEQDMKEMERRKRVKMIFESQIFKEELERIIETQLNEGYSSSTLSALQQVTQLLMHGVNSSGGVSLSSRLHSIITPINDIRGIESTRYDKREKQLRCKLAAVNRLVELNNWSFNSCFVSLRITQENEHFLTNPYGLLNNEVSASSLLKVDMQGNVIDPGSTNFTYNRNSFNLHSAIHLTRPDIKAIIHLYNPTCVAISSLKKGLLCISPEAAILGDISYHNYKGTVTETDKNAIGKSLGTFNKVLILRNYGILTCGTSIEEAYFLMENVVAACEIQLKFSLLDNVIEMSEDAIQQTRSLLKASVSNVPNKIDEFSTKTNEKEEDKDKKERVCRWKIWDVEFESKMRMLDNAGFRTGYNYKQLLLRVNTFQRIKPEDDIEIPPASQSHLDDSWIAPLRKLVDGKRTQDRLCWVNTPNSYQRIEIEETGTSDPKKITKWVQDGSPSHQKSVKIDISHQFVPLNVQRNEFREKQKELKFNRLQNKVSEGPRSKILEESVWEDVNNLDTQKQNILIGTASKGIIKKEFQQNTKVYKSAYEKNPFDNVTVKEIQEYHDYIEKKQRGEDDKIPEHVLHLMENSATNKLENVTGELKSPLSENEEDKLDTSVASKSSVDASSKDERKKDKKKKGIRTPSFLKKKTKKEKA